MIKINGKNASNKQMINLIAQIIEDKQLTNLFSNNFKHFIKNVKDVDDVNTYLKSNVNIKNYENIGGLY